MKDLETALAEDKALRDAALGLFKENLAFVREDLARRSVATRIADRLGESASGMMDDAIGLAERNRWPLAAAALAGVLWLARGPVMDGLASIFGGDEDDSGLNDGDGNE